MSTYTVSGRFQSRDGDQPFTKDVEAETEDLARKRTQIDIEEVSEA